MYSWPKAAILQILYKVIQMKPELNIKKELFITKIAIALATLVIVGTINFLANSIYDSYTSGTTAELIESIVYAVCMFFVGYGSMFYLLCIYGAHKRALSYAHPSAEEMESLYDLKQAPSMTVIIPSYKEERKVNLQTMLSAALAEYPEKNVVLLIDDPYQPANAEDAERLEVARNIPKQLQKMFDEQRAIYAKEIELFRSRAKKDSLSAKSEYVRLAKNFEKIAEWLFNLQSEISDGNAIEEIHFADRFFINKILQTPAINHLEFAKALKAKANSEIEADKVYLRRQYNRLIGLFSVNFSSFERKRYANLSHEANKAMNLNSYIGLIGKSFKEMHTNSGIILVECANDEKFDLQIPDSKYVNTIDADTIMTHDYFLKFVPIMEKPENTRLAVLQSPCSSFEGCDNLIEYVAGAYIDSQFRMHQGYSYWNASYWVGANAMLRKEALDNIRESRIENGHEVYIYIQDRTLIEDTESSIDLVYKGWKLLNYPERLTFSATPSDFGSLLIQRRRWANGGILILPKLFRYFLNSKKTADLFKELYFRFSYLGMSTILIGVIILICVYPFPEKLENWWITGLTLIYISMYSRDVVNSGYKVTDVIRILAQNTMLLPVVTGGVFKSIQQAFTGKKIPFARTPKVPNRTAAPAVYCVAEIILFVVSAAISYKCFVEGNYAHGIFTGLNALFLGYSMYYFIGIKAIGEDIKNGFIDTFKAMLKTKSRAKAEVISIPKTAESILADNVISLQDHISTASKNAKMKVINHA